MNFLRKLRKKFFQTIPQFKTKKYALRKNHGQHTIEYVILLTLIMAGIMIMGPYVIRSWNAQVKGWEDSVVDSLQDPLIEAPSGSISVQGCDPQPWIDVGCAVGGLGWPDECGGPTFSCSAIEMLMRRPYNPDRCQCAPLFAVPISEYLKCEERTTCCTAWSPSSTENTTLVPPPLPADCGVNATTITGVRADGLPGCEDGQARQTRTCGAGGGPTVRCFPDPDCIFNCLGTPGPNDFAGHTGTCSPPYPAYVGLSNDTPYTYVDPLGCDGTKCQIQCSPTFVSKGTYCGCRPGQNATGPGGTCVCDPMWVKQNACANGFCFQGSCGACEK